MQPASRPPALPDAGRRDVLVLGNYMATINSYQRLLDGEFGGFGVTWRNLRRLLGSVEPRRVYLTNAFIGLPELDRDTAPFPTTPSFLDRCHDLLELQLRLFRPRVVVCLGTAPTRFLARRNQELAHWKQASLSRLIADRADTALLNFDATRITAVAVRHPASVISNDERHRDATTIKMALKA